MHWCEASWEVRAANLTTIPWQGSMTGGGVAVDILKNIDLDTSSDGLVFATTSDGGSNMLSAGRDVAGRDVVRCFLFKVFHGIEGDTSG